MLEISSSSFRSPWYIRQYSFAKDRALLHSSGAFHVGAGLKYSERDFGLVVYLLSITSSIYHIEEILLVWLPT